MEHRNGICASCEANYTIPASFEHDKARCRECGGTVEIGPVVFGESSEPQQDLEEHVPSGKKGSGPSMMEKLRAQRAAAEEAAAGGGKPKPEAVAKRVGRQTSKPAAKPSAKAIAKPARAAAPKAGARKSGAGAGKRKARASKGSSASKRRSGGSKRSSSTEKKKAPMGMIIGVGGLVILLGVSVFLFKEDLFKGDLFGSENKVSAKGTKVADTAAAEEGKDAVETTTEDATSSDAKKVAEATKKAVVPPTTPEPKTEAANPADKYNPDTVDLASLTEYGPADGTTEEEWEDLQLRMVRAMNPDLGKGQTKEWKYLEENSRKAFPAIVNYMLKIDFLSKTGADQTKWAARILENITKGQGFGFKEFEEDKDRPDAGPLYYAWFNKGVALAWYKAWDKARNDLDVWGKMLRMKPAEIKALKAELSGAGDDTEDDEPSSLDLLNED